MNHWFTDHWLTWLALALGGVALWWLLPQPTHRSRIVGGVMGLVALVILAVTLLRPSEDWVREGLFYFFSAAAIVCAVLMITNRNPVYAALWFALVTLSTCGLFLLRSAPFLAAATVIVYAGAIVVTFLFVIMLAQQAGSAVYDQRTRQPGFAAVAAVLLAGALVYTLEGWGATPAEVAAPKVVEVTGADVAVVPGLGLLVVPETIEPNPLSRPVGDEPLGLLAGLGRSLFGDYLFAVELAGTLLLVASIGAIAIAPRRSQGTL